MVAWLSRLFEAGDPPAPDDLRTLKARRRQLINSIGSLRAYGFDTIAREDEAALKSIDRKICALQLKSGDATHAA
jgi:hypothetical protein